MTQNKEARDRLAARRAEAYSLYVQGWTQQAIAEKFDSTQRTISDYIRDYRKSLTAEDITQMRERHTAELRQLRASMFELTDAKPAPVTAGKDGDYVRDPETGEPVYDYGLRLSATDRLLKIQARESALHGLDAPTKAHVEQTGTVTYVLEGDTKGLA